MRPLHERFAFLAWNACAFPLPRSRPGNAILLAPDSGRCYRWRKEGAGVRVIGFDPGLRTTGWGVVDWRDGRLSHVANGACTTASGAGLAARLAALHAQVEAVIVGHSP